MGARSAAGTGGRPTPLPPAAARASSNRRFWREAIFVTAEIKAGPEPPPSPQSLGRKPAPGTHPGAFRQCHWIIREVANFTSYVRRVADPKHHTLGSIWMLSHDPFNHSLWVRRVGSVHHTCRLPKKSWWGHQARLKLVGSENLEILGYPATPGTTVCSVQCAVCSPGLSRWACGPFLPHWLSRVFQF